MVPTRLDFSRASTHPSGCGFSRAQIRILGIKPRKGWVKKLIGTYIDDKTWNDFVVAGNALRKRNYKEAGLELETPPLVEDPKPTPSHLSHPASVKASLPKSEFIPDTMRRQLFDSDDWRFARAFILRKFKYTCAHCRSTTGTLHVDHIVPVTVDWSRRLDLLNLQVLCADCNKGKSNLFVG